MQPILQHLATWAASMRYSIARHMMFRADFLIWLVTDLLWMSVNLLSIEVIYGHTDGIAGWTKHELMLLMGTALLQQRLFMGLFFSGFYDMGRHIRQGTFDFFIAQPGTVLFMVSTRKLELDGLSNSLVAAGVVAYAAHQLNLQPSLGDILGYGFGILCGVVILYSLMALLSSIVFWTIRAEGTENGFFTISEFARLPKQAYTGITSILIGGSVIVMSSNVPANLLRGAIGSEGLILLAGAALLGLAAAAAAFHFGLRSYTSASS